MDGICILCSLLFPLQGEFKYGLKAECLGGSDDGLLSSEEGSNLSGEGLEYDVKPGDGGRTFSGFINSWLTLFFNDSCKINSCGCR